MQIDEKRDTDALTAQGRAIERAITQAVHEAVLRHKRLGESIVVWRDGKVVEIPPEEIPDDGEA